MYHLHGCVRNTVYDILMTKMYNGNLFEKKKKLNLIFRTDLRTVKD